MGSEGGAGGSVSIECECVCVWRESVCVGSVCVVGGGATSRGEASKISACFLVRTTET